MPGCLRRKTRKQRTGAHRRRSRRSAFPSGSPPLESFDAKMSTKYHTQSVKVGTFEEQADEIATNRTSLPPGVSKGTLDRATWEEWSPPGGETYKNILRKPFRTAFRRGRAGSARCAATGNGAPNSMSTRSPGTQPRTPARTLLNR